MPRAGSTNSNEPCSTEPSRNCKTPANGVADGAGEGDLAAGASCARNPVASTNAQSQPVKAARLLLINSPDVT
jgi:hypothetical protein